jgi:hypothetical protein
VADLSAARDRAIEALADRIWSESHVSSRPGQCEALEQIAVELRALAGVPDSHVEIGDVVEYLEDGGVLGEVTAIVGPGRVTVKFPNGVTEAQGADLAVIRRRAPACVPSHAELVHAIADPGAFVRRGDNYEEPIPSWSARAVLALLGVSDQPEEGAR